MIPHHELENRLYGVGIGSFVDLLTPFAVVGVAAVALALLRPRTGVLAWAILSALAYVDGHGIHLAANSIAGKELPAVAERTIFFWDERFGHLEWHLGWLGLVLSLALADPGLPVRRGLAAVSAAALGAALAGASLEGRTWGLVLAAVPIFTVVALRRRGHVAVACGAAIAFAALVIGGWALYWGALPQPTDVFEIAGVGGSA